MIADRLLATRPLTATEPVRGWVRIFIVANLAFLGADIGLAHLANAYARTAEWIPLGYSAIATVALAPGLLNGERRARTPAIDYVVGVTAILLGVAGMLFHLASGFFAQQTLHNLVYAAPFAAPLAYVGVGLLLLLDRLEPRASNAWGPWVTFLACAGFVGNFVLSLLDHAQNGFFRGSEWVAVSGAAFAVAFLTLAILRPDDRPMIRAAMLLMGVEVVIGVVGFVLHVRADLDRSEAVLLDRALYGAPLFAPLLFADLAVLGALGLRALGERG